MVCTYVRRIRVMCDILNCSLYISAHPQLGMLIGRINKSLIRVCYVRVFYVSPKLLSSGRVVSIISTSVV